MNCSRRCPGLPETWVLAPALPIANWGTSGQSFYPSGGFLAHKIRVLEEAISVVPSSSLSFILKQTCWAYRGCLLIACCCLIGP